MKRNIYAALGVLAALGTFSRATLFNAPAKEPAKPPAGSVSAPACLPLAEDGPWQAAKKVFALSSSYAESAWPVVTDPTKLGFLIVTVADPDRTHLDLATDRALESITWAVGDAGYSLEGHWLPWSKFLEGKDASTVAEQQCREKLKASRESQPGLLVFRRNTNSLSDASFLFVFVVGETPTSGVDKQPLANAVAAIRQFAPNGNEVKLLGPTFSGSFAPLLQDLAALPGELRFRIVSGTASNRDVIQKFAAEAARRKWSYESAVENDVHASELFFRYLNEQWRSQLSSWSGMDGEIAILSEDETVFGAVAEVLPRPGDVQHKVLALRYPREIARLRNASPDGASGQSTSNKETVPTQNGVALSLKDAFEPPSDVNSESVETFSGQQSPASQQAALLAIASQLRRERAAFTGVVATDVLDSLFLTQFLRRSVPDIRVFMLDADLLFLRESEATSLVGTLSVTNYPLFSRNQHWTDKQIKGQLPRRIQFNSRFAEGIYNACRRLLREESAAGKESEEYLEYQRPFPPEDGKTDKKAAFKPALWLTTLGRDGYWPVALLDDDDPKPGDSSLTPFEPPKDRQIGQGERLHPEPPSSGWGLVFALASTFCFLHALYVTYLLSRPEGSGDAADKLLLWKFVAFLFPAYPAGRPTDYERAFLLAATISQLSSLMIFSWPLAQFLTFGWAEWYGAMAALVLLMLLVTAVRLSLGRVVLPRVLILSWTLALAFVWVWSYLVFRPDNHSGILLAYRALYLGNGVSPGIPILLLAAIFYGWAWVHLKREQWSAGRRFAAGTDDSIYLTGVEVLMRKTDETICDSKSGRVSLPALVFVIFWFALFWPVGSLRSIENLWYDRLYVFVLTVLYWCIALVWTQFLLCWLRFREFLRALERQPIRYAFSRLPKEISWIPLATSPSRNLFLSSRSVSSLEAISSTLEAVGWRERRMLADLAEPTKAARLALTALECQLAGGDDTDPAKYKELQQCLNQAADTVAVRLRETRWKQGDSESLSRAAESLSGLTPEEKAAVIEEEFVALRLLMFIRYVIRHFRNFVGFIVAGFIVSILSLNSYPFQAGRWIGVATVVTMLALGSGVAYVFAEMDKDALLSRITDTQANQLGKTFFVRLATFGALPLLTVLAAQFPAIGQTLSTWLQPALEALK